MFESLPAITQENLDAFVDLEFTDIVTQAERLLSELDQSNERLAHLIRVTAETAAETAITDPEFSSLTPKEIQELFTAQCRISILLVLRLIDRALEAQRLEQKLSERR